MSKKYFIVLILLCCFSCKEGIIPEYINHSIIESFYVGTIKVSIYSVDSKIDESRLSDFPKDRNNFEIINWNTAKKNSELKHALVENLQFYRESSLGKNDKIGVLISELNDKPENFLISGYYVLRKSSALGQYKLFDPVYLIDKEKKIFYKFTDTDH